MNNDMWMSYEEWAAEQKVLHNAEARVFRQNGLGWLVDFCSKSNDNECTNDVHRLNTDPTGIGSADGQATKG
jgi:hypothetical protein